MQDSSTLTATPLTQVLSVRQRYLRQLAFSILWWSGIILLEGSTVFAADVQSGHNLSAVHYLAGATFNWFLMIPLTPLIYQLGQRYPIVGPKWASHLIEPHVFACSGCLFVEALGRGSARWVYTRHHELSTLFVASVSEWIGMHGAFAVVAYFTIVFAAGCAQLREQARQCEVHRARIEASVASAYLERLRVQLSPHLLRNTLQAAITLVRRDPPAAEDVLLHLSQLLPVALDEMETNEIPLSRELEILDLYMDRHIRRFGKRLRLEIHVQATVLHYRVPPLILQPLVENAICHGISKRRGQDCIEIFARQHENNLQIEVRNRNSIVTESGAPLDRRGVGLRNTRARLEHSYGPGSSLIFRPLSPRGAVAIIVIPLDSSITTPIKTNAPIVRK
jgi:two-component system LytT family sensor kinase